MLQLTSPQPPIQVQIKLSINDVLHGLGLNEQRRKSEVFRYKVLNRELIRLDTFHKFTRSEIKRAGIKKLLYRDAAFATRGSTHREQ